MTILLAKTDLKDTRHAQFAILKWFSQLLLLWGDRVQEGAPLHWRQRGNKPRTAGGVAQGDPTCKGLGVPTWPVKLDVRKAFDSVGGHGCSEGGEGCGMADGMPWEARAWLGLLEAREVRVAMQDQLVSTHAEMACGSYCVGADDYLTPGTREHLTSFLGRAGAARAGDQPAKTAKEGARSP